MKYTLKLVIVFLFRWFYFPVEPGLHVFGTPDEDSPVFITCNFILTLKRLSKYLKNLNCYLLVAPTKGINVWCAAAGDVFTAHSVISAIKTSKISEKVTHQTLIAPQLSAPGIDTKKVLEETGWQLKFGPVYAKDIHQYINEDYKKTKKMHLVKFNLRDRMEMATNYFASLIIVLTIPIIILFSDLYLSFIILTSIIVYGMYIIFPYLPTRSGFKKSIFSAIIGLTIILVLSRWITGNYLSYPHLLLMNIFVVALIGFDFNGMSPTHKSDLGMKLYKHPYGEIQIYTDSCTGCTLCYQVCPRGVYEMDSNVDKARLIHPKKCVNCNACVLQCPENCLEVIK